MTDTAPPTPVIPDAIRTHRLVLRPYADADGPALFAAVGESRAELRPWLPWTDWHPDVEASTATCRRLREAFQARKDFTMGVFLASDGRLVGGTGLHRVKWEVPSFEIGYWARTSATGHGYFTESTAGLVRTCFEALGAQRVEIYCDPLNAKSSAVAERVGFVYEGTLRRALAGADGTPRDKRAYSLVRDDWARERARILSIVEGRAAAPARR